MDETGFSLKDAKIAMIGLGLMGGSLALSLRHNCQRLSALDTNLSTLELARVQKIVDVADSDPDKVLADADLVILACPIPAIIEWINRLQDYIHHPCIVMDIGSTKRGIVKALETLPANFDPIGGHAICGREHLSLKNAEPALFHQAPFALTPLARTSSNARNAALQILEVLGANPLWCNANDHDRILANTSHMPYLLSSALALIPTEEAIPFIGSGFRSTARLAGTPSSMMLGVLLSNHDNILTALRQIQGQLSQLESALENDPTGLQAILDRAQDQYHTLMQ
ncbi:MAG: prephenate dehydrogenase/arogenate dehydrogenase family protein [Chloroflexota bacterium]